MTAQEAQSPEVIAERYVSLGMPASYADYLSKPNPVKNACILELYRSALNLALDWGGKAPEVPGLSLRSECDQFADETLSTQMAAKWNMPDVVLPAAGHWWMIEAPDLAASMIKDFWKSCANH